MRSDGDRTWKPNAARIGSQLAGTAMDKLVRRNLRGVWVRGELPSGPAIWVSNHHSWWDYFVAAVALRTVGRFDTCVLVEAENIGSERLFRAAGAIPSTAIRQALANVVAGGVLVVFVEGELRPCGPVAAIKPGATWLARRSGAPVVTVATRVVMRGQQAPEAYLDVASRNAGAGGPGATLAELVTRLDEDLSRSDPSIPLPGFRQVAAGARSWNERLGGSRVKR